MNDKKILSLLGLAAKAGRVKSGEFMTEKEVKEGRAYLVIAAEDASDNTRKKFQNMCDFYKVPIRCFGNKVQVGHAIGKEFRASLAVCDRGFAAAILKLFDSDR